MRMNRVLPALVAVVVIILIGSFMLITAEGQTHRDRAQGWSSVVAVPLTGDQQISEEDRDGTGIAILWPSSDLTSICYLVHVDDLDGDVSGVGIYRTQQGGADEAVLIVPTEQITGDDDGIVAFGNVTSKDLTGSMEGSSIDQLIDEMEAGNLYVNVITDKHPDGEIHGYIDVNMTCDDAVNRSTEMRDHTDHHFEQQHRSPRHFQR